MSMVINTNIKLALINNNNNNNTNNNKSYFCSAAQITIPQTHPPTNANRDQHSTAMQGGVDYLPFPFLSLGPSTNSIVLYC